MKKRAYIAANFEPEYFEPGTLVVLDPEFSLREPIGLALAGARPDVDDVVGVANRVFIVLNDHQRVAFVAQTFECTQQNLIVPRVQSNGRLVKHVTHALQVASQLGRQANPLGLAATQSRSATVKG